MVIVKDFFTIVNVKNVFFNCILFIVVLGLVLSYTFLRAAISYRHIEKSRTIKTIPSYSYCFVFYTHTVFRL